MSTKHEKSFVGYDRSYETNIIGLRGIIYFAGFLIFLIVITFGLMYFLQNVMEDQAVKTKDNKNPMMQGAAERLPPEPRLQAAPGYGVESQSGWVNLELSAPQAEYRALKADWEKMWANGQKDEKTGTVVTLPVGEAVKRLLEQNANTPAADAEKGQKVLDDSRRIVSYSSAGRTASDVRR